LSPAAARRSTTTSRLRTHCYRHRSKLPLGRKGDVQEHLIDGFNYIYGSVKKKILTGFLGLLKPKRSVVPFGKLRIIAVNVFIDL
jgi:hypothetical protein